MRNGRPTTPIVEILATGLIAGGLYFIANLIVFFPHEQLSLMGSGFLRLNIFAYSFSIWTIAFVILSAIIYLVTHPLVLVGQSLRMAVVRRFIVYFVLVLALAAGHAAWRTYTGAMYQLPNHMEIKSIRDTVLTTTAVAAGIALCLSLIVSYAAARSRRGRSMPRVLLVVLLLCLIYSFLVNLPFDFASLGGGPERKQVSGTPRIVVYVVDAGSWNVILPFLDSGALPGFRKIMDEGTYGYLDVYGIQYTPPSWTTIATGKEAAKHGIYHHTNISSDWRAAPIWSVMSSAGRSVGVVNWVVTWPPFRVNGAFISEVMSHRAGRVHFSADSTSYMRATQSILERWDYAVPREETDWIQYAKQEISKIKEINQDVISKISPDLVAYGYYSPDKLQHLFWKHMSPDEFAEGDWQGEPTDAAYRDVIRDSWLWADGFLSDLMDTYGDDAYYFVVSDHGAKPINKRTVLFDMNGLLAGLGYLTMRGEEIHYESSTCYVSARASEMFRHSLEINPNEYTNMGDTDPGLYREVGSKIVNELRALEVNGRPIFERVVAADQHVDGRPDIVAFASRAIMAMPETGTMIVGGARDVPLADLLSYHRWSGEHRARGIFLAKGPLIRQRYTGAWTMDEPYTSLYRNALGIFRVAERFRKPLRALHLIDEITTLDVAPTILYLSDLPVADDMDGRLLAEIISKDYLAVHTVKTVLTYERGAVLEVERDEADEQKIRDRLRAVGYIQ